MDALYEKIGEKLKKVFTGWEAWIIGYREEYFRRIGLAPSTKIELLNGSLECQLRQYIIFEGSKRDFRAAGGRIKEIKEMDRNRESDRRSSRRASDRPAFARDERKPFARKPFSRPGFRDNKTVPEAEPENPLARRRNPDALKSLIGRKPSLPPSEGPIMRSRGWKKKD